MKKRRNHLLRIVGAICCLHVLEVYAQPGDLDAGCGAGGIVTMNMFINGALMSEDYIRAVRPVDSAMPTYWAPIYIGGQSSDPYASSYSTGFLAARLNTDGTPDVTFGSNGRTLVHIGSWVDGANDMVLTSSGIVLAGYTASFFSTQIALIRLNSDGTLDNSFGIGGKVALNVGSSGNAIKVTTQSDGKILVLGSQQSTYNGPSQPIIMRLLANGSLDTTFGNGGIVPLQFPGNPVSSSFTALATHTTAQITDQIIVGGSVNYAGMDNFSVARLNLDGTFDETFNGDGTSVQPVGARIGGGNSRVTSLLVEDDNSIVAAGSVDDPTATSSRIVVVRYKPEGTIKAKFGNGGMLFGTYTAPAGAPANLVNDTASIITAVSAPKYIVTGTMASSGQYAYAATRFFAQSGMIDDLFGWVGNTFVPINVSPGYTLVNSASAFQVTNPTTYSYNGVIYPRTGRALLVGHSVENNSTDLILAAVSGGGCQ